MAGNHFPIRGIPPFALSYFRPNPNGFAPFVDSGQLRLLATFGAQRTRRWPQVPTLKELGHGWAWRAAEHRHAAR